jgi:hypothetical protein
MNGFTRSVIASSITPAGTGRDGDLIARTRQAIQSNFRSEPDKPLVARVIRTEGTVSSA